SWSLTSLQQRLFKTGGRLIRPARYFILQLAESYLTGGFLRQILQRIERLAWPRRDHEPHGGNAMTSEWRSGRGVSERDGRSEQPQETAGAHSSKVAKMTAIDMLGRADRRVAPWAPSWGRQSAHIGNPG